MSRGSMWSAAALVAVLSIPAAAADKKVERLFNSKCSSCHGKDGKAQTENGQKMKMREMGSEEFQKKSDDDFKKAISDGVKTNRDGVKQEMDAFKEELKPAEIDGLVKFVRELKK